ncbi:hypothetical protein CH373_16350 [Leptospira perolatii]|uniref:Uncharacterized protein n=1 Tax=Leptospira perolatii TaxID=2023191 RepID=A0A2M9ZIZ0_9LEPT|nr:hypothetical protein CH360_10950 [Leptospira perolatii]PJZ72030.1 hypothetical protein CH373_16350 [Leptospira perolatii]
MVWNCGFRFFSIPFLAENPFRFTGIKSDISAHRGKLSFIHLSLKKYLFLFSELPDFECEEVKEDL